ncbi:MAG TPA: hypothetical protein EYN72_06685 [Dehalococcoidia bacterium]|jgi:hypothetical protein|nr:hypothetical protein [SAR202 cluster bacterium]HCH08001.1 hypothetical protein [Dehalococcoidia bacterium]HHZ63748.1 hypothetical protein [Dehalococcoidia bacterium]HIA16455.1 hypothetical protein [Dehalococcoidia bacterium]HIM18315.1 hypothetical protein [Dehalococcoidia bacterium]|tara:strand:+ start:10312 stop:10749 length:438 start_codon:yes stop_codon:yes gene_type:complete
MEGNFLFEIDEVLRNVQEAEVMSIFFPSFRRALIIDTRSNTDDGPMVRLMPMASSPQDRVRSIRKLRPGFPRLQNLTLIPWQRYVDSLVNLGVWEKIVKRIEESGDPKAIQACDAALTELRRLERQELVAAISGDNYQTIWSASK